MNEPSSPRRIVTRSPFCGGDHQSGSDCRHTCPLSRNTTYSPPGSGCRAVTVAEICSVVFARSVPPAAARCCAGVSPNCCADSSDLAPSDPWAAVGAGDTALAKGAVTAAPGVDAVEADGTGPGNSWS